MSGERPSTRLILASASPRRRELIARLGFDVTIQPANIDESVPAVTDRAERVARRLAREKAMAVLGDRRLGHVLAADTIVVFQGRLLGKPETADEARRTLRELRGKWHRVITGVALASGRRTRVTHAVTRVRMRDYSDAEIERYIERGEPFDKAGSYAIQDPLFCPVERYDGCYCNVVGLPLASVLSLAAAARLGSDSEPPDLPPECACCPLFQGATAQ